MHRPTRQARALGEPGQSQFRSARLSARAGRDRAHTGKPSIRGQLGKKLWIEINIYPFSNHINRRRLVVFTGPIFGDIDPVYRGVQIPPKFFKVAAFMHHGSLAATGYVVDQTPQLADLPDVPRPGALDNAPPLGPFRTFQAPIRDIGLLTGLDLEQLTTVDRMPIASTLPTARVVSTWRRLRTPQDLDLDFERND